MSTVVVATGKGERATPIVGALAEGFEVRTATTWSDTLGKLDGADVVVVDRSLSGLPAAEVPAELRKRGHGMPVAAIVDRSTVPDTDSSPFDARISLEMDDGTLVRTVRRLAGQASSDMLPPRTSVGATAGPTERDRPFYRDARAALADRSDGMAETLGTKRHPDAADELASAIPSPPDEAETAALLSAIDDHTLPADLETIVADYQELRCARPPFMWKWVHHLAPQNALPCVEDRFVDDLAVDKTLLILFITLLDDTLEQRGDRETFNELATLPTGGGVADPSRSNVDRRSVEFAQRLWDRMTERIGRAPLYDVYEDLFRFDVKQAIDGIEYSDVVIRRPDLATMGDLERYESHNMVMLAYADIDLMHSPLEVRDELPVVRSAIWTAQTMARIGNWVSTWERELEEGDFCSGPVVYALNNGIVDHDELRRAVEEERTDVIIQRLKDREVDQLFLRRWRNHRRTLQEHNGDLASFDLGPFIDGTEEVLRYHLASTGLK